MLSKNLHRYLRFSVLCILTCCFASELSAADLKWNVITSSVLKNSSSPNSSNNRQAVSPASSKTAVSKTQEDLICKIQQLHPLDCWLRLHPTIANKLFWNMNPNSYPTQWTAWDENHKAELRQSFDDYVLWYQNGMTHFQGTEFPDPIPNGIHPADDQSAVLNMNEPTAWAVYRSYVAFILAAEIEAWFPWSILDVEEEDLKDLFLSSTYHRFQTGNPDPDIQPPGTGYFTKEITPAPPTVVMHFLKDNNLIQTTPTDTVGALLNWMKGLNHIENDLGTALNYEYYWGYRGPPPLSRIFSGTHLTDPQHINGPPGELLHWIHACFGSTYFLQWVGRIAHIPVRQVWLCGHSTAYFPTLKKYLSHGDDPYNAFSKSKPDFPGTEPLVDTQTFRSWFGSDPSQANAQQCNNIGRQPKELALKHLPDYLVYLYCQDQAAGKSHAEGQVMDSFKNVYTLENLEAMNLWGKLNDKAQADGACATSSSQ